MSHIPKVLDDFNNQNRVRRDADEEKKAGGEAEGPLSPMAQRIVNVHEKITGMRKYLPGTNANKEAKFLDEKEKVKSDPTRPEHLSRALVKQQGHNWAEYKIYKAVYVILLVWFLVTTVICIYNGKVAVRRPWTRAMDPELS